MPKAQETVLEIHLDALTHNYKYLKSKLNPKTKFLAVVKAFAYGSDAEEVSMHLQNLGADYFAVAYTQEGKMLRGYGITKPILVLHPQSDNLTELIEYDLEPSLYSLRILKNFIAAAEIEKKRLYPIHINFNTGLNRLGFTEENIASIISDVKCTHSVKIKGIFSHLAASEDIYEKDFSIQQISKFETLAQSLTNHLDYKPMLHLCNTSGVINYPTAHFDMVRCGIGLYGFGNSAKEDKNLKPIANLKSVISQIHHIKKGETVGYNRAFKAEAFQKTATIPLGHADGITRQYGNGKGHVIINDKEAPIIGNVCMDMIMVNVTNINCQEGDEVIIFNENFKASDFANLGNTISYEVLTMVSQRVKRVIYR